jgi:hypothetical protein
MTMTSLSARIISIVTNIEPSKIQAASAIFAVCLAVFKILAPDAGGGMIR